MDIEVRKPKDGVVILDIDGEIDIYNSGELKNKVQELMDDGIANIVFNMAAVPYIDSSGIGALIASLTKLKKAQGTMKIYSATDSVRKVFELTKMTSFFEIYGDEAETLATL